MSELPRPTLGQELSMRRLDAAQHRVDAYNRQSTGDTEGAALSNGIAALQDAIADKRVEEARQREGIGAGTIINTNTGEVIHAPGQPTTFRGSVEQSIDLTDGNQSGGPSQPPE